MTSGSAAETDSAPPLGLGAQRQHEVVADRAVFVRGPSAPARRSHTAAACASSTSRTRGYAASGGGTTSAISSAAVRSRIARLAARITGARRSVEPPLSERYWRTASSSVRDADIASWPSAVHPVVGRLGGAAGDPLDRRLRYVRAHREAASIACGPPARRRAARPQQQSTPRHRPTRRRRRPRRGSGPTLHPVGTIRLKMISTIIVNIAWPGDERRHLGHVGRPERDDRQHHPHHGRVDTHQLDEQRTRARSRSPCPRRHAPPGCPW